MGILSDNKILQAAEASVEAGMTQECVPSRNFRLA